MRHGWPVGGGDGIGDTATPTSASLALGASALGTVTLQNISEDYPGAAIASLSGADAAHFSILPTSGAVPLAVGATPGELDIDVTRTSGASGASLSASLDLITTEGDISVPITATVPDTLLSKAYGLGFQHIFPFDDLTDQGNDPDGSLTLSGGAALSGTGLMDSAEGKLVIVTDTTDRASFATTGGDWKRNADRTWLLAFKVTTWTGNRALVNATTSDTDLFVNLTNMSKTELHLSYTGGWVPIIELAGFDSSMVGKDALLAITFDYSTTTLGAMWQLEGGSRQSDTGTLAAGTDGALTHALGGNGSAAYSIPSEIHFFGVWDEIMGTADFDAFATQIDL